MLRLFEWKMSIYPWGFSWDTVEQRSKNLIRKRILVIPQDQDDICPVDDGFLDRKIEESMQSLERDEMYAVFYECLSGLLHQVKHVLSTHMSCQRVLPDSISIPTTVVLPLGRPTQICPPWQRRGTATAATQPLQRGLATAGNRAAEPNRQTCPGWSLKDLPKGRKTYKI